MATVSETVIFVFLGECVLFLCSVLCVFLSHYVEILQENPNKQKLSLSL